MMHRLISYSLMLLLLACGVLMFLALITGYARAASVPPVWEDVHDPEPDVLLNSNENNHFYRYNHDITMAGFESGVDLDATKHDFDPGEDLVTRYRLAIGLHDDSHWDSCEWAYIDLPGIFSDTIVEVNFGDVRVGWSALGLLQLNTQGKLTINIHWLAGDFYFAESTLYAWGCESNPPNPVPLPAPVILLGAGLAGLVALRRKVNG